MALFKAVLAGDDSAEAQAESVTAEALADSRLSEEQRFELASHSEVVRQRRFFHDRVALKRERVASARHLMRQFPDQVGGYAALLQIAESEEDPGEVISLTAELLDDSVPRAVRGAAQVVHDRAMLPGKPVEQLMQDTLGHADYLQGKKGKVIVLYAWADWSPGSIHQARELMILAPEKVEYLGLFAGEFTPSVLSVAVNEQLPGEQISGRPEQVLALARALNVGGLLPFYLIGPDGNIASVSTELEGLTEKVRQLAK